MATVFCLSAGAQTINVMALDQAGAQTILQAAKETAQQRCPPNKHGPRHREGTNGGAATTVDGEIGINQARTAFLTADVKTPRA